MTDRIAGDFLDAWARAYTSGDVGALVSMYTSDALFFGSTPTLATGHADIRAYFEALAPHEDLGLVFDLLAVRPVTEGVLEVASVGTFRWAGNPGRSIRFTHTLVHRDGTWLAAGHHASPHQGLPDLCAAPPRSRS